MPTSLYPHLLRQLSLGVTLLCLPAGYSILGNVSRLGLCPRLSVGEAAYMSPVSSYPGADTRGGARVASSAEMGGLRGGDLWEDSREE